MLKIVPMTKAQEQERVCLHCGLTYQRDQFAYGAYEDEKIIAGAQFTVKEGAGTITDLRCAGEPDFPVVMLLGRAVLNFLDLHEVREAYFEPRGEFYDVAAAKIGFKLNADGRFYAKLDKMFTIEHESLPHS